MDDLYAEGLKKTDRVAAFQKGSLEHTEAEAHVGSPSKSILDSISVPAI